MPIGPDYSPPGVEGDGNPNAFDRFLIRLTTMVGVIFGAAGSVGAASMTRLRQLVLRRWPVTALDPALAADAVVRNVLPGGDWAGEAELAGIDRARFDALVMLAGNPPGPQELLEQWRFGQITDGELEHGIRQGRLKDEWIDFYKAQRHLPLSAGDAVRAAVQNHVSYDYARRVADMWGVAGDEFDVLYQTAGRPPGIQEMLSLWRRGIVTEADVDQAVRESDVKDKYLGPIKRLAEYVPPPRTVTTLLSHGAIDRATAEDLFRKYGLSPELAAAYAASAVHAKAATHKELASGQVSSLYADRLISRDAAVADLVRIGYSTSEAGLILDLADDRARQKIRTQAVNRVRTLFVGHKIDRAGAESDLAKIGVAADQVAELLPLWAIEQSTPTKQLTQAELTRAFRAQVIDLDTFRARLRGLGYDQADADILVALAAPPQSP